MKNLLYAFLAFFLIACDNSPTSNDRNTKTPNASKISNDIDNRVQLSFDSPSIVDSTEYLLLPIKPPTNATKSKDLALRGSYGSGAYQWHWNLLFFNRSTQASHLLTESKIIITSYTTNVLNAGPIFSKSILYNIRDTDYNGDGKLEYKDPEQLFISDLDGKNLRKLSPANEALQSYTIIPHTDQFYFSTLRDKNQDLEFKGVADETIWYFMDLAKGTQPIEMVNTQIQQKIMDLYDKQWSEQEE